MKYWNRLKKITASLFTKNKEPKFLYEIIGEEKGVYELVRNFYEIMETDPSAKDCLVTHKLVDGAVPDEVKKKFFMFLCGWFGGPNLYVERIGQPRMRARHIHVKIGSAEKTQWLNCMFKAMDIHSYKIKKNDRYRFEGSFKALADRIQNT
jgi:hemoglobin